MQNKSDERIVTIGDNVEVGPALALLLLIYMVITGQLPALLLAVVFLWSLGKSVTINWRKFLSYVQLRLKRSDRN